jgi:hypothetical protein
VSAVLEHQQIQPVIDDLERLQNIRNAMRELRESEIGADERVQITFASRDSVREVPICFVHEGSVWLANVALQAMEREVKSRLASAGIEVEAQA